jgi:hypothetical protein
MCRSYQILIFLFLLFNLNGFSQTGPGGVGSNDGTSDLILWFRSDNGLNTSSSNVSSWENSAGYSELNLTPSSGVAPTVVSNNVNGYDEVLFNAQSFLYTGLNLTTSNFITNEASTFTVTQLVSKTSSNTYGTYPLSGNRFNAHIPWNNNQAYFDIGQCCGSSARLQKSQSLSSYYDYSVWTYGANASSGKQMYRNGNLLVSKNGTSTFNRHSTSRFQIGQNYKGKIPEIVIYKSKVNTAQRIIVDNYLSAKYGLSLSSNDLYAQDNPGNGDFDHNVAGIGQAADGTNHTNSKGTGMVQMHTPSSLSNGEYLFWGENVKESNYEFTTDPVNYMEQLSSKWRITKINDLGTVTVSFDLSGIDLSGKQDCQPLQLIVDSNNDFSTAVNYNLTITGNTATATNVSFNDNDYFTLQFLDQIIWDGSTFFNGSGAASAPNDTNECLKLTVKTGATAILTSKAHVREIEIETGAKLEVTNNTLLEVEKQIIINGIIDLQGESQLIQNHTGVSTNSGNGELKINQQGATNLYNYNYWSSPVNRDGFWKVKYLEEANGVVNFAYQNDADPTTSPITLSSKWLYGFNAVQGNYYGWNYLGIETDIAPGIGYSMKGSGNTPTHLEEDYSFKGAPNNGDYSYTVTAGNNFLVGNPYPSALNAIQFINDNLSTIDGTLYFWEQFATNNTHVTANYQGGYATLNLMMGVSAMAAPNTNGGTSSKGAPKTNIPVGQGFFVNVDNGGPLVFNNSQRIFAKESLSESTFFRETTTVTVDADNRTKFWLTFSDPLERERELGLGYDANASTGYNRGYDAIDYSSAPDNISWVIPDYNLSIQALQQFNVEDEMPLFVKIETSGTYTLSLKDTANFPENTPIYLKDNLNTAYYNLKEAPASLFLEAGENDTRYSIVYKEEKTLSIDDNMLSNTSFSVTYNNLPQQLTLNNYTDIDAIKNLNIYNLLGQQIISLNKLDSNTITLSQLSNAVYIVEIIEKDNGRFTRKFIKD